MVARAGGLSAFRLTRRSLLHRRAETVLILVVSALIVGLVVFLAGYQQQAQRAIVDRALAVDGPGNAWQLTGPGGSDLIRLIPADAGRWTRPPVAGAVAEVTWTTRTFRSAVNGALVWRDGGCGHVTITSGSCPDRTGEVLVSEADAAAYKLGVRTRITDGGVSGPASALIVSGLYRVDDPTDPFWFGNPPTGRSGVDQRDLARSDNFITVAGSMSGRTSSTQLDVRIDGSAVAVGDVGRLSEQTRQLVDDAARVRARVATAVPATVAAIGQERERVRIGLALTGAQLGMLMAVVVALLASVHLADQRYELGLQRLRGQPAGQLRRLLIARWAAVTVVGGLLGWVPAAIMLELVGARLPGRPDWLVGPAPLLLVVLVQLVMVAMIVPGARALLAQPVIDITRSVAAVRAGPGRQLVIDAVLLVSAACGLLAATQTGGSSLLGLLAPSLLAIGLAVLLVRVLIAAGSVARGRLLRRSRRPAALLSVIIFLRLRGLRILTVTTTLAAAFVIFTGQLAGIGEQVRRHDAEVRTGAPAVLTTDGDIGKVVEVLDRLDPGHAGPAAELTPVVITRRADDRALRAMFVEPAGFAQVAHGAAEAVGSASWSDLEAPRVEPVAFTGTGLTLGIAAHRDWGAGNPGTRQLSVQLDYLTALGRRRTVDLGSIRLAPGPAERLRGDVDCAAGCRLLRINLVPQGLMSGTVELTGLSAVGDGATGPLSLGPAEQWQTGYGDDATTYLRPVAGSPGLTLEAATTGRPVSVQQAWVPVVVPVAVSGDVTLEGDPTIAAPDGAVLPIRPVIRTVDAVPGQLSGVAVADLEIARRLGLLAGGARTTVQVWVGAAALGRVATVERSLTAAGLVVSRVDTVAAAQRADRFTAAALTGRIAPGLGVLAAILLVLGVWLTAVGRRPVLSGDLAALRLGGVGRSTRTAAVSAATVVPLLAAVLVGAAAGALGSVLVVRSLPLLPNAQSAIRLQLDLQWSGLIWTTAGMVALVVASGLLGIIGLFREVPVPARSVR